MTDEATYLEQRLDGQDHRLQALEVWKSSQDMHLAARTERDKYLDKRFDRIEASQNEIKGYLLKIVWVIIIGVLSAVLTFVIRGGLSAPV